MHSVRAVLREPERHLHGHARMAGTAALMWGLNQSATYTQVRNAIFSTVDPIFALRTDGPNPVATGGRLNAAAAVQAFGFAITSTSPTAGAVLSAPPTEFVLNFAQAYNPATVQASDLTVNGIPADFVELTDEDTLTFTFTTNPVATEGLQTMSVAAGAITGMSPIAVSAFTSTFRFDTIPLVVMSISPASGLIVTLPFTFLDVTFNEAVSQASLQTTDLVLSRGTVSGFEILPNTDGRTVRFRSAD